MIKNHSAIKLTDWGEKNEAVKKKRQSHWDKIATRPFLGEEGVSGGAEEVG